ncbi:Flagellar biosynthetic protein FlhB [Methylobacterium cerastii]|uniref:Flagellar biosynthetic protein FlhB n=1 Tax=Methylobacterium cerastii TaxID=932741 RepID=A0ABQ4QJ31_9HYPH|nr:MULTISPECIES: flagellar biosynthesis protein FlhB [Methylobacterium]TXN03633.1 flagellar biosynthesis protein FlhB [Methylobacterium sp. WL122]TXM65956.1 flagellar biosynthesis protein FlhB [Methylobacterium sp. WL12]TXM96927.1 flagellar biosynthesis protein FlhB [Methylobacterium sp. WL103]TXN81338.1 flagellar biosynthesis protein FlhB [Methylobacterium sp. WL8]GJD45269.1 Flagellar biosynthetic protein FlhB [Methylobacterium cerastii]
MSEGTEQEDKTEEPTQRRLDQAIEQGNVATSTEINTFAILAAFTLALVIAGPSIARGLVAEMRGFLMNAHAVPDDPHAMVGIAGRTLTIWLQALAVPAGLVAVAGLAAGLLQHPLVFTTETLGPKFERISPMAGVKRILGMEALFQFVKGLAKMAVVGVVVGTLLWRDRDRLEVFARLDPAACLTAILGISIKLLGGVLAIHLAITMADALYQRYRWRQRLRMSKEEMKQEMKESDGNPEVKGRMKQIRMQRVKKRMMAAVPTATVVITNPTHYAVALRYEAGMGAPVVVAKGVDSLAFRIRELAKSHDVPVLENPPLARALHATVEIDEAIPAEHYKAVAEVIGFVMRLRRRAA